MNASEGIQSPDSNTRFNFAPQSLRFIGHEVLNPNPFAAPDPSGRDVRLPFPTTVDGILEGITEHQVWFYNFLSFHFFKNQIMYNILLINRRFA